MPLYVWHDVRPSGCGERSSLFSPSLPIHLSIHLSPGYRLCKGLNGSTHCSDGLSLTKMDKGPNLDLVVCSRLGNILVLKPESALTGKNSLFLNRVISGVFKALVRFFSGKM